EAESKPGREQQIEAARDVFYRGFIAEEIDTYLRTAEVLDASGNRHKGVLTAQDMAKWSATIERPVTHDYHGWSVSKTDAWGQGPVLLQALSLLDGFDIGVMDPNGAEFVHVVVEAMKLAFADREAYYGDPKFSDIPLGALLSPAYSAERRKLIGERASFDMRPGIVPGFEAQVERAKTLISSMDGHFGVVFEPTMGHLSEERGDTVHIDVIDRWGNMVSVTPSGGWLQSSPIVPGLGFCLNSRAQMFWLTPDLPASLAPGRRPRTTLTPSLARHAGGAALAFGTPGGDQQDQWQLAFFLRHVHHGFNLQESIDLPLFHTSHFPASFYPRSRSPGNLMIESSMPAETLDALVAKGHKLELARPWTVGRLTAARRDADGLLRAAATPRLMQAYAIGR
ncbi:MAG: gamma-glutamyltransferase family protein, partial [Candidatus Nanopelagicales bacterium]